MTAVQYYFPYLFNLEAFNSQLQPFGLCAVIKYDNENGMPEELVLEKQASKDIILPISFGKTIMIFQDKLFYWDTDTDLVDISQVNLHNLTNDPWVLHARLDLKELAIGSNSMQTFLDIDYFITYARKSSITYPQEVYEKFSIVIVLQDRVIIIPFDWFNKKNSEYDYTWPATARLQLEKELLHGQGMRMPDFCIELDVASL